MLAGSSGAEGPAGRSGDASPASRSVTRAARSLLSSVADALWADGPPQRDVEQQVVHGNERELFLQERRGDRSQGDLGLICMALADMQGEEKTKYAITSVMGSPEFHGIHAGLVGSANMIPDFTSWLEIAKELPPGTTKSHEERTSARRGSQTRMGASA